MTAQDDHQRNQGDEISAQLQRMLKHTLDSGQADPALEFLVISQRVEFFWRQQRQARDDTTARRRLYDGES